MSEWKDQCARDPMPVVGATRGRVRLRDGSCRTGRAVNYQWTIYGMWLQMTAVVRYRLL